MTDYEIASLFYGVLSEVETAIVNYTTVLFAFLVFAYFAADRLKPYMVAIVLLLFSAFSADKLILFVLLNGDLADLSSVLQQRLAEGSGELAFIAAARGGTGISGFFLPVRVVVLMGGYVGALLFFFHQRKARQ